MQVTIPQTTVTVPGPAALLRSWRWALLAALVLAFTLAGGASPAAAAESTTSPDTVGNVGYDISLALDAGGDPAVSYYDNTNDDLKLLHCNDANCAGGGESVTSPDTSGDVGVYTSLALDVAGNPVVSYYDISNLDLKVLHCNDANCAGGDESITSPDTVGEVGSFTSLELDASGNPVVSYQDGGNDDVKVLHCNDANCSGGGESITSPDTVDLVGYYTSLALDASGRPVVSYYDLTNRDLKLLHCNDANCDPGGDSITSPETTDDVGLYSSLALDVAGNPVVSHQDATNSDLKLLHCNDPDCAGGNESITTPDDGGTSGVGYFTSLALDGGGNSAVSYYDATNGDLKLLHCNDADCAGGGDSSTTVDSGAGAFVGLDTSLALDAGGNPVVSYRDLSNGDLKLLHCNDPDCSSTEKQLAINITNVGQYVLPKTCFEVRNASQIPYFTVCDNDFAGAPDLDPICLPDGVCNDDAPLGGSIRIPVEPGDYRVVVSQGSPEHTAVTPKQVCTYPAPVGGDKCDLTFSNTPKVRPWHPWDITGGPGGTPDGVVRVQDILEVVNHYFDDKPLAP